jgi:DNA-directed RNA polymerase specialized sigma24 family protein
MTARCLAKTGLAIVSLEREQWFVQQGRSSDGVTFDRRTVVANSNSVTCWLDGLKAGDSEDIRRLWDRYFARLVRLAGARIPGNSRRAVDEEDVALSAFESFCAGIGRGQFPQLSDREDLWRLLSTITTRKVIGTLRHHSRQKRGGDKVLGESALTASGHSSADGMARFLSREPTPESAAEFADVCEHLFAQLADPVLKSIALGKLEGRSSEEIAAELGTTRRTIDRKLQLIRAIWEREGAG